MKTHKPVKANKMRQEQMLFENELFQLTFAPSIAFGIWSRISSARQTIR